MLANSPLLLAHLLVGLLLSAVCELCHRYKEQLVGDPKLARTGIAPLLAAWQRLAPSREHLTPIHADVMQL